MTTESFSRRFGHGPVETEITIHEDDQLDEELVASWITQASELPGETCF